MKIDAEKYNKGKKLPVVEEFYTLQGEGHNMGKAAYFLRIGGCDVGCSWCDTKLSWNPELHPAIEIETIIENIKNCPAKSVVITGGEPMMFNLDYLCDRLKEENLETFIETSGVHPFSGTWDWVCLSPKKHSITREIYYEKANELKVIIAESDDFEWAVENSKKVNKNCHLYLQPEWSRHKEMMPIIVEYVKNHPEWRISLQAHKYMRIP
ncbi:MAG: 7-carboxy-7-deazaguanine synthase QueE [Bacteroidales bacterium]|nr:7-carboxy-7-deazaguanine synthase QueE [Bacteroidales bacterium]MCF8390793.1 7-carboxy-7-deazaguanine synthase QueE [Bacteroidales bacterium]